MPAPTTIRALFHPLENEAKDAEKEKKEQTQHQQRFVESKSTFFSSKFILFFFDSGRKTKEISIPVAFDKQKSNFLIGPSALWWREAFAISSSLLREEESSNGVTVNGGYKTNDEAAMADLGHAAEATLEIARVGQWSVVGGFTKDDQVAGILGGEARRVFERWGCLT
jgi:hypothetical protein